MADRDKIMIEEIKRSLSSSMNNVNDKRIKSRTKFVESPFSSSEKIKKTVSKANNAKKLTKNMKKLRESGKISDIDEILQYYSTMSSSSPQQTEEDKIKVNAWKQTIQVKTLNQPFSDNITNIDEYLSFSEKFNSSREYDSAKTPSNTKNSTTFTKTPEIDPKIDQNTGIASSSLVADKLKKKYPRFCSSLTLSGPSPSARSDVWLCRFIEDSYDEARAKTKNIDYC
jgi:hypothetical protein